MNDDVSFRELLKMDVEVFHYIVDLVRPAIWKQNTSMRASIPPAFWSRLLYSLKVASNKHGLFYQRSNNFSSNSIFQAVFATSDIFSIFIGTEEAPRSS